MAEKSKVLVIGVTALIGKFVVEASAKSGHPTFALVGPSIPSNLVQGFNSLGVHLVHGDINDPETLFNAIKKVDVVISTVETPLQVQYMIVAAIATVGNIKRFLPSVFGNDVDRARAVEPARTFYAAFYTGIRHLLEEEGIPYTFVSCNFLAGWHHSTLAQPGATAPPRDKVVILGDGNAKVVFNREDDIGTYTIKAVDDPRTLNKILHIRPPANTYSMNDLTSLWERKIGKTLQRVYIPEEQVLKIIQDAGPPADLMLAISHSVFVKGDQTNFEIEPSFGVEASELYPDVKYTTVDEYLDQFV
ncbi:phenylcoumaran benzylic ether reductase POP1-like [Rhodamnia argentea]|uniref:Phenylcoumaran benzylic ether reductase POP1-like n=1 Tax=Rhodamnia argentea TaxID=178133 RepID=A0ABM3H6M4_9MYRT|nr:phenylcoumaran benzylic ether reductase POP1-like [Rhodamnia argentea]